MHSKLDLILYLKVKMDLITNYLLLFSMLTEHKMKNDEKRLGFYVPGKY